jgi:hypothetical protein
MNIFPNIRKFVASSDLFSGFELDIDLNYCNSLDDIVNTFYENLYNVLLDNKFEYLINEVKKSRFHIHNFTFEDIITSKIENIFYICDHC